MAKTNVSQDQKFMAAAGYLWILSVIVLAVKKNDAYVRFHASQGALIFVCSFILMFIPMLGWFLNLLLAIAAIVGIIKALRGEEWALPVGADLAAKFGDWVVKTLKL